VGEDSDADPLIDNWDVGIFFSAPVETLDSGVVRYRSMFYPPAAAFSKGRLTLAFGTGEREDLRYAGDPDEDDNNRLYVVADLFPTGASAFASTATESNLTDVTGTDVDGNPSDLGFYFSVDDGEKFVTDVTIFAGIVFVASYTPVAGDDECVSAGGQAFLYAVDTNTGQGQFDDSSTPPSEDRRTYVGGGLPSNPVVSMAPDPDDDRIYIKTSTGQVIEIDPDVRNDPPSSAVYWRQIY
jgi:hypothetical protein